MAVQLNKFKFIAVEKSLKVGKRKTKAVIIEGKNMILQSYIFKEISLKRESREN